MTPRSSTLCYLPLLGGLIFSLADCGGPSTEHTQSGTVASANASGTSTAPVVVVSLPASSATPPAPPLAAPPPPPAPQPAPVMAPPPAYIPTKLCATVPATAVATGTAMTFAQYTAVVTPDCGGGACHTGALPHGFVGELSASMDPVYSTSIIIDLRSGAMPKGTAISATDEAAIIDYLCGHLDI